MYETNDNLSTVNSIFSGNVRAVSHGDHKQGDVVMGLYGDDTTVANQREYIVAQDKTTTVDNPNIFCIVQGTYNINGLTEDSNTETNITALANHGLFGIIANG